MIIFLLSVIVVLCVILMRYSYKSEELKLKIEDLEADKYVNDYKTFCQRMILNSQKIKLNKLHDILEEEKTLWGLEFGNELSGKNIGAVVLFSSRSGARRNKKKGDRVVKVNYRIVE